jgi:hypothetical protein
MRRERGYAEELPDLAVWTERSEAPGAVIADSGGRREDRQKLILEGWRDAVRSGRYFAVRYDCPSPSVAQSINRLAKKVGLTNVDFTAAVQTTAEQIAALRPAAPNDEPAIDDSTPSDEGTRAPEKEGQAPIHAPQHRPDRCKSNRRCRRLRSPNLPRPRRSASDVTATSSASMSPSPAADGAADDQLLAPSRVRRGFGWYALRARRASLLRRKQRRERW